MKNIKLLSVILGLIFAFTFSAAAQSQSLVDLNGKQINIEGERGKVVVLAIGASWLPLSKNQIATVNKLTQKYANRDVVFYFIATDSTVAKSKNYASDDDLRKFAATNKLTIATLRDGDGMITIKKFKIDQLPAFVVLDKDGVVATAPINGIDPLSDVTVPLSSAIDKILQ